MESTTHSQLKSLSLAYLAQSGVRIVAPEVLCPLARFRLDVAGYLDALPKRSLASKQSSKQVRKTAHESVRQKGQESPVKAVRAGDSPPPVLAVTESGHKPDSADAIDLRPSLLSRAALPRTVVVECKASRSDFLKDATETLELMLRRDELSRQCDELSRLILRSADADAVRAPDWLFDELAPWDYSRCRTGSYQELAAELAAVHRALHGRTKFEVLARYRLADVLLIATPVGMIQRSELPPGWGMIEFDLGRSAHEAGGTEAGSLTPVRVVAARETERPCPARFQTRLLRNIAVAATRTVLRQSQVGLAQSGLAQSGLVGAGLVGAGLDERGLSEASGNTPAEVPVGLATGHRGAKASRTASPTKL